MLPSPLLLERAERLHSRFGNSFYDSLILAAAIEARCSTLYSEDLQHGQKIEGVEIVNPFLAPAPAKSRAAAKAKAPKRKAR